MFVIALYYNNILYQIFKNILQQINIIRKLIETLFLLFNLYLIIFSCFIKLKFSTIFLKLYASRTSLA